MAPNIKCFVTFLSPGTFCNEESTKELEDWCSDKAIEMAAEIKERWNATPFGFYFTTRELKQGDFDSKEIERSGIFHIGGKILSLADVENRKDPKDRILISNMRINDWDYIVENTNSWKHTSVLYDDDIFLQQ